ALVEACWSTVRQPGPIAAFYQRVRARRGHSIAIVASARKLACLFWCLLSRGEDYAFAQPSLTKKKLRRLELQAGAPRWQGGRHRDLVHERRHAPRRTRARRAGRTRLQAQRRRLASHPADQGGRECDTGARISRALEGLKPRGRPQPRTSALR